MKPQAFFCIIISSYLSLPCLSQVKSDEIRLTYFTGKDFISQKMNEVFYCHNSMDSLKYTVKILCIDMQSEDIDTIPPELALLEEIEHIEIEWKSEATDLYGFHMFPKLKRLSLNSSKLNLIQNDTVWLKQIEVLDVIKNSELKGLNSFAWLPNLTQLYVEFAKLTHPLPKDINSLTKLKVFRCGPKCSLIKDLGDIDLGILLNISELNIETSDCETVGIPANILLSKSLRTLKINHPNLTTKEKEALSEFRKKEKY